MASFVRSFRAKLQSEGIAAALARGASGSLVVQICVMGILFCLHVLLGRMLGAAQYGVYMYVLSWINLIDLPCELGLKTSLVRFVSAYRVKGEWSLLRGIMSRSTLYVICGSFSAAGIIAIIVWLLRGHLAAGMATTFWVAVLLLPVVALTDVRNSILRGLRWVVASQVFGGFLRPQLQAVMLVGLYWYSQQAVSATQAMMLNLIAALLALMLGTWWLFKILPYEVRSVAPSHADREWLKVSLPLLFTSSMQELLHYTDILIVGSFMGPAQVGIYAAATRISALALLGLNAVTANAAPLIAELFSMGKHDELQRIVTLSARGILAFTTIVGIALAVLGVHLMSLFGQQFTQAYTVLLIMLFGTAVYASTGPVGFLMSMTGHQNQMAWILGAAALVNVLLNLALVPVFGINGAATATVLSMIMVKFLMFIYVRRKLDINPTAFTLNIADVWRSLSARVNRVSDST